MRGGDHAADGGHLYGYIFVYGVRFGEYRPDVALGERELSGVLFGVRRNVDFDDVVFFLSVLGSLAVRDLFRVAPRSERVAVEEENQSLGGVRRQGGVVRRYGVSRLGVAVARYDDRNVDSGVYFTAYFGIRYDILRLLRLRSLPLSSTRKRNGGADR